MGVRLMLLSALSFRLSLSSTPAFDYQCPMSRASLENSVLVKEGWRPHRYSQGYWRYDNCRWRGSSEETVSCLMSNHLPGHRFDQVKNLYPVSCQHDTASVRHRQEY